MGDRKALVVGINDYPDCQLHGCLNDAEAVKDFLANHDNGDPNFDVWKKENVKTKGELKKCINQCFGGDAEVALFYFSGHGYIDDCGGYLVTPDYSEYDFGVSLQEVLTIANNSKCKERIIILDCCHSGFMGSISTESQDTAVIKNGVTILTASRSTESSVETDDGHGLFTSLFCDALKGEAADVTGHITVASIYAYIDKALGTWEQRPVFKTNVSRFTSLRDVKPQVDISIIREITKYFNKCDDKYQLNPSYEPTNSKDATHQVVEPYANEINTKIFKNLQMLEGIGLVIPSEEEHMYYAAMNSKACELTPLGKHYWKLVKERKL